MNTIEIKSKGIENKILSNMDVEEQQTVSTPNNVGPDGQPIEEPVEVEEKPKDDEKEDSEDVPVAPEGLPIDPSLSMENYKEPGRVRRLATIMNMLNSLLGAGILSVPKSLSYCGIVPSLIILIIIAILSHIGTVLTIKLQYRTKAQGLDDLALIVTGKWGSLCLSILSMIFCISAMVGYLVIGSDMLLSWFKLAGVDWSPLLPRALVVLIYSLLIPGALTVPRSIAFLSYFSFATVICICIFFVAMIVKACIILPKEGPKEVVIASAGMGLFSAISIYALSFALPIVVLPIIQPYNKNLAKRGVVSMWTCILCFILVAVPAVLGYVMLGSECKDNILNSFPDSDILILIVRIGFFLVVSFSYPCLGQSILSSWSQVLFGENQHAELILWKRAIVILCTNIIPILIAMFLKSASPALSVGGAIGGCVVDFFYPALMWVLLSKKKWTHWQNILCILFAIFGIVCGVICTYQAIVDAIVAFS